MTTYAATLREPTFRVLFGTRTLSILADTLRIVALSLLVYAATDSPALAALAYGIGFLPQLFGAALFGALADRVRARRLIVAGYLAEALAAGVLALVALPVWASLLVVAVAALITPVFYGAQNALIATVLTGEAYVLGRSLANMASSLAQLVGMAGAGLAVAALGGRRAMLLAAAGHLVAALWTRLRLSDGVSPADRAATSAPDAVTDAVSPDAATDAVSSADRAATSVPDAVADAVSLDAAADAVSPVGRGATDARGVATDGAGRDAATDGVSLGAAAEGRRSLAKESWLGNVELLREPVVRRLLVVQWLPPAFVTGAEALLIPYAGERGFPVAVAGWLLAAVPVGMIAGNLLVGRVLTASRREKAVRGLVVLMGVPLLAFLAPLPWTALIAALGLAGAGFAYALGVQEAFRDALPERARGQGFALLSTGLMTAQGLLPAVAGLLAEVLAPGTVIGLLGVAALLAAALAGPPKKDAPRTSATKTSAPRTSAPRTDAPRTDQPNVAEAHR